MGSLRDLDRAKNRVEIRLDGPSEEWKRVKGRWFHITRTNEGIYVNGLFDDERGTQQYI